jgi:glycosyltransferase involved in cell wall biosynthesis
MYPTPLVSVIIPAFNRGDLLREAIASALAQTYRPIELLVIDDGSTEDIASIVAAYGPAVRYLRQANAGPAAARNNGIRHSTGELIALLDSDDRWLAEKLARQVPHFAADPDLGMVHSKVRFFRHGSEEILGTMFSGEHLDVHQVLAHNMIATQTTIFRRAVFDSVGGFDESLLGPEDFDFFVRVTAAFKTLGIPDVLAEARQHGNQYSASLDRMFRCQMRVVAKHQSLHKNCPDCRRALAELDRFYRQAYCRRVFDNAREAARDGHPLRALQLRLRGLRHNPGAVFDLPSRLARRMTAQHA